MTAPETKKKGGLASLAPFPKPFWVINGVELFERGAYYGMLAVLSVFLTTQLGFPAALTGLLLAIQFPLLYFLPVFAGALADKVGFKRLLIASFGFLIAGYVVLSAATNFMIGLAGVVLYGIGAGLFKPMPAATVTDTTSVEERNFGFSIYYWMINLGAFLAPIGMQRVFGGELRSYFLVSAGLSVLNLAICLTLWKDIRPRKPEVKVGQSIAGMGEIFRHPRFVVLLAIYCGFWFMYAITTSFLQLYAVGFGIMSVADVALLVPANALAILVVGPVLSKMTGKLPSLPLMTVGITVFCAGFLIIGFIPTLSALLAGIFVYSIGEFLTHPSYLSYVSKIAPPDKVPLFLGYGFIPIGIGQFLGTLSGGFLYGTFAEGATARPQMFWVAIVSVGMLTVAALLIYNYFMTSRRAIAPGPSPTPRRGRAAFGTFTMALLAILAVPALLAAATIGPGGNSPTESASAETLDNAGLETIELAAINDRATEGETNMVSVTLPDTATGTAVFTLSWTDEVPGTPTGQNAPDEFVLHVTMPNGTMVTSQPATNGEISLSLDGAVPGVYTVGVELVNAGDTTAVGNPLGLPLGSSADTGNDFTLAASYQAAATA